MNYISILGLLVLLGSAWLLSYHRSDVKLRPIIWGIGLQLLFALIILREDMGSFIGMSLLSILIIIYIHQKDIESIRGHIKATLIIIISSLSVGYALFLFPTISKIILIVMTIFLILGSFLKGKREFQEISGTLFIISGTTMLITNGLYGKLIFKKFSEKIAYFLSLSDYGAQFLFGHLANGAYYFHVKAQKDTKVIFEDIFKLAKVK